MSKQLRAAFLTWRNPVTLVFGLGWLALIILCVVESSESRTIRPCHPVVTVGWDKSVTAEALLELYHSDGLAAVKTRLAEVEELRIDAAWNVQAIGNLRRNDESAEFKPPPGGLISLLPECTRLRRLWAEGMNLTPENLQVIGSLHQLEELTLARGVVTSRGANRPPVLAALNQLRNLRKLDLSGTRLQRRARTDDGLVWSSTWHMDEELEHLSALPSLRTLTLSHFEQVTGRALQEVSALPQVETLVVDMVVGASDKSVTAAEVAHLQSMPNLRTLYVPYSRPYQDVLGLCRELLPGVSVRRGTYDATRVDACFAVFFILFVTVIAVVYQLMCSLLCSVAPTTPQFQRFHLRAAGIISAVSILICLLLLLYNGAEALPAVSLCVVFVSLFALVPAGVKPAAARDRPSWPAVTGCILLAGSPVLIMVSFGYFPHWYDAWLAGDWSVMAGLLLIASVVVLTRVPRALRKTASNAMEIGISAVAGLADLAPAQQQRAQLLYQQRQESGRTRIMDPSAFLDERLRSLPGNRGQRQLALLRAGSGLNSRFMLVFGFLMIVFTACIAVGASLLNGSLWDSRRIAQVVVAPICMIGLMPGLIVVAGWRMRMNMLGLELLRPISRSRLRRMLFQSIALDLAPFFAHVCLLATGLAVLSGFGAAALANAVMFASLGPLLYGVGLWVVLIRRTWLAILIGFVLLFARQISTALLMQEIQLVSSMLLWPTMTALVIGLIAAVLAWNYWPRREMA